MTAQIPAMKSTTKITLSDRFTQYQKMRLKPTTVSDLRAKTTSVHQASAVNRRHVQELENRPSVQAADSKQNSISVMQRLGPCNVKSRMNLEVMKDSGDQRRFLGSSSGLRGGFGRDDQFRGGIGRQSCFMGSRGAGVARRGRHDIPFRDFRGNREFGRGGVARDDRGAFDEDRRSKHANRLRNSDRGSLKRGGRGRVRDLHRGRGLNVPITEEQLNYQLDEYMSKCSSSRDQEKVKYMDQNDS
ncbi:hypothetical protein ACJMK2_025087 [Sinanodonta woodiana]|uniref:Chromatin target of PRMT1 protein C-terminal domain-containing protein n=1 Tax=Sinanodonta woodiana TaxID=1069815 RepID=A0ABD3XHT7_SINWO